MVVLVQPRLSIIFISSKEGWCDKSHTLPLPYPGYATGITIVENSLSEYLEDAMPGHTSFSTGASVKTPSTATESEAASTIFTPATLIDDFKLSKEKKKRRPVCSCTCTCRPLYVCVHVYASRCVHACVYSCVACVAA